MKITEAELNEKIAKETDLLVTRERECIHTGQTQSEYHHPDFTGGEFWSEMMGDLGEEELAPVYVAISLAWLQWKTGVVYEVIE